MMLVKLGGSVITDKTRYRTFREEAVGRLAREIASSGEDLIIVHGAGSFGHVLAAKHGLQHGFSSDEQIPGAAKVMEDVRELNLEMIRTLNSGGVPCASIPPSATVELRGGRLEGMDTRPYRSFLGLGITPVTFGDVAPDKERGFGICSGDQLMERLAEEFRPDRVIFCADVDGVFTADPNCDPSATLMETVDRATLDALPRSQRCVDVTGSIFAKLETMMRIASWGGDAVVINGHAPGRLEAALRGEKVIGSKVVGERR